MTVLRRSWFALVLLLLVELVVVPFAIDACSPRAIADAVVPPLKRAGKCMLLRALAPDGTTHEVCAELDELSPLLAPLVDELLEVKGDARERGAELAFAMPAAPIDPALIESGTGCTLPAKPKRIRAPPRRRCAQWIDLTTDASVSDAARE